LKIIKRLVERIGVVYLWVIGATLLGKLLGLVREGVIAYKFGTSHNFDIYLVASIVPVMIASLFMYALPHVVIPRMETKRKGSRSVSFRTFSLDFFWSFTFLNIIISFLYLILSPILCQFLFPTVSSIEMKEAVLLSRIFCLYILFAVQFSIIKTFYSSNNEFILPEYVQLITHICVIGAVFILADKINTFALLLGLIIGTIVQVLILLANLFKRKILKFFRFGIRKYSGLATSALIIILIEFLGQTYSFIDRSFFERLPKGFIGGLYYAGIISNLPIAIFAMTLGSIAFPKISQHIQNKNYTELKRLLLSIIGKLLIIAIPITLVLYFFSDLVVKIILQRGAFDADATKITSEMLKLLSIGLPFVMIHTILAKIIFALKKEIWFLFFTIAGVVIKFILTYWFVSIKWFYGVALSTSIVFILTVLILSIFEITLLRRRYLMQEYL
jgi:putative peptidoglycan lipid II flippase